MSSPTVTPPQAPPPQTPPPMYYVRRRSIAGPIVLIALGVLFLLGNMHMITWARLSYVWARYWPVLIILWGVIKLYEHWSDQRQGLPGRGIGAGGVILLIFLIIFGVSATAAYKVNWGALNQDMDFDNDFAGLFGNSYNFTQTLEQPFTAGNSVRVVDDRGEVTVNTWDEPRMKIVVNKRVIATSENEAKETNDKTVTTANASGNIVNIDANTRAAGKPVESNLQIFLPKNAPVEVVSGRGDVNISSRDAEIHATTAHGDVTVQAINGNVNVSLNRGSVRVQDVKGDVSISGRISDTTVNDVSGTLNLSGDYFGQMSLARIGKGVVVHTSRTDMEMGALAGDLSMESGDLRAHAVAGPMRIITRSKDIHIEDVVGDLKVQNSNGMVEYQAGNKLGAVDITNSRGDVQLSIPPKASFQIEAEARRGDVSSEFEGIATSELRNDHSMKGTVGAGGPEIRISNTSGDISLRKGIAPPPPEKAGSTLPPDQVVVPGGGVKHNKDQPTPPKPPKAPKAAPPSTTTYHFRVGPWRGTHHSARASLRSNSLPM